MWAPSARVAVGLGAAPWGGVAHSAALRVLRVRSEPTLRSKSRHVASCKSNRLILHCFSAVTRVYHTTRTQTREIILFLLSCLVHHQTHELLVWCGSKAVPSGTPTQRQLFVALAQPLLVKFLSHHVRVWLIVTVVLDDGASVGTDHAAHAEAENECADQYEPWKDQRDGTLSNANSTVHVGNGKRRWCLWHGY